MDEFEFSNHALKQMAERNLSEEIVLSTIQNTSQEYEDEDGQRVYQQIFNLSNKEYLVRVFVNAKRNPPFIKTVYRTSKIKKYLL